MNKTAIKNFAVWAHNKLISEIYYKAGLLGITKAGIAEELSVSTDNLKFYDIGTKEPVKVEGTQIKQRDNLVKEIRRKVGKQKFEDAFENFVEEVELFEKARQLLAANADKSKNKETNPYSPNIFKCSLLCPHCGRRLHRQRGRTTKKGETYYFICLSKSRVSKNACVGVHINEAELKERVLEAVSEEISSLDTSFSTMLSSNTPQKASEALKKKKCTKLREYNKVQGLIRSLYENLVQDIISNEFYKQLKHDYEMQADELQLEIETLDTELEAICKQQEHYNSVCDKQHASHIRGHTERVCNADKRRQRRRFLTSFENANQHNHL